MRLLTRADFDGMVCGALLKELGIVDSFKFVHPKDIQDGLVKIEKDDILANIPYAEGAGMWFDHHLSENERIALDIRFEGESGVAPSCARVIYEYYDGDDEIPHFLEMVKAADKADSANYSADEILNPTGWVMLSFLADPRTGLGRFKEISLSHNDFILFMIEQCSKKDIEDVMNLPDVKERVEIYNKQNKIFKEMLLEHSRIENNIIITDLRGVSPIYTGNRFLIYSLFPEQNISMWIVDVPVNDKCSIAVGHSIINRSANFNVGSNLLKYGGGGHFQVGTCQISTDDTDKVIAELINKMKEETIDKNNL